MPRLPNDQPNRGAKSDAGIGRSRLRTILLVAAMLCLCLLTGLVAANAYLSSGGDPRTGQSRTVVHSPAPATRAAAAAATPTTPAPSSQIASEEAKSAPPDHRFAVLLLGYGGGGHDGAYLTDSMMVLIADPDQKTLTLLSLPRDLWVPLDFGDGAPVYNKVNTAYAFARDSSLYPARLALYRGEKGAGTFARDTVSRLLGIPINYYLGVDFQGFRDSINTLGGIDVVVPASFSARYPRNDDPSIDPSWMTVRFAAGPEHMSGERALQFARAREALDNLAEGTDFARANRQRIVLTALKSRLLQPSALIHLPQLLGIAQRSSDTDYPLPALADLTGLVTSWGDVQIHQASLTPSNYLVDGAGPAGTYILVPKAAGASWSTIRAFARRLWADPADGEALATTSVVVANRTGQAGLAGGVSDRLSGLCYVVGAPETGTVQARTTLHDESGGRAGSLLAEIERDLGLRDPLVVVGQSGAAPRVVVELGTDSLGAVNVSAAAVDSNAPTSAQGVQRIGPPAANPVVAPSATPSAVHTPAVSPVTSSPALTPSPRPIGTPGAQPRSTASPTVPAGGASSTPARAPSTAVPAPRLPVPPTPTP